MVFKGFDWDSANIEHVAHNVVPDEVEEACVNKPYVRKTLENRYLVYGITDVGRYLFIVGVNKGRGVFRTIAARDMTENGKSLSLRGDEANEEYTKIQIRKGRS